MAGLPRWPPRPTAARSRRPARRDCGSQDQSMAVRIFSTSRKARNHRVLGPRRPVSGVGSQDHRLISRARTKPHNAGEINARRSTVQNVKPQPGAIVGAPGLAAELADFSRSLRRLFDAYRPERHYMRGRGPKWHAKYNPSARGRDGRHGVQALGGAVRAAGARY
jgi:hypothetical protein